MPRSQLDNALRPYGRTSRDKFVGGRLKQVRGYFGMSTVTLAMLCDAKERDVAAWEAGRVTPSDANVLWFERLFKKPVGFFYKPLVEHFPAGSLHVHYRSEQEG